MNMTRSRAERMNIDRWAGVVALVLVLAMSAAPARAQDSGDRVMGLTALVRTALDSNRDLIVAREGYVTAKEQVSEAWSSVLPSIDFSASYTRNISPAVNFLPARIFGDPDAGPDDFIPVRFGADNQWSSTILIEQAIFRPTVLVALGAASRFEGLQNEVVRGQAQSVVTQVRTGYYSLLLAQEQSRLTENSVERVHESLKETRALNTAGLIDDYDVLRLEVELANLEPNLRRARNAVLRERRELAIQVNLSDHETLEVTGALAEMDLTDLSRNSPANQEILLFTGMKLSMDVGDGHGATLEDALARVGEMRSDLRQLELTEELRHTEVRAEQATYLPEITVFGSYIITAQDNGSPSFFGRGDGQRADSKSFGLRVSLPIFQGFRRDARIDQKRAAFRQAQAMTSLGIEVAQSQVRTIVDDVEEAYLRATSQRLAVRQAQRGFEIASAKYSEGLGSRLELTDAEVALRQSEFNYAQAVYDYLVARAQLDEAVGKVPLVDMQIDVAGDDR